MLEGIKNIVFDIGGVLIDLDKQKCSNAFKQIGFEDIDNYLDYYCPVALFNDLERGKITVNEACNQIRTIMHREVTNEQIRHAYTQFLDGAPVERLRAIKALRDNGINTYALSNISDLLYPYIRDVLFRQDGLTERDYFVKAYLSYEMHALKPDREIFEMMIADSGMLPEQTLYIDDSPRNIDTARELGFNVYMPAPREDFTHIFDEILK